MKKGFKHSEETRKKMSLKAMGHSTSMKAKMAISKANKGNKYASGYKHTEAEKEKMRMPRKNRIILACLACERKIIVPPCYSEKKYCSQSCQSFSNRGQKNSAWKGDAVTYRPLHSWVSRWLGKPGTCCFCGKSGLSGKQIHWANKSREYKRDLKDWFRLCAKCHKQYDKPAMSFSNQ